MSDFACQLCPLHATKGHRYVRGIGNPQARLMIICDAPSFVDSRSGVALSGENHPIQNGDAQLLAAVLASVDMKRDDVWITNLVQCCPPLDQEGFPTAAPEEHMDACHFNLDYEVSYIKPEVIITMGATAAKRVTHARTLGAVQGRIVDSADCLGFTFSASGETKAVTKKKVKKVHALNSPEAFKVVPTHAFSMVRRDPSNIEYVNRAFRKAKDILDGKVVEEKPYDYKYAYTEEQVFEMLTEIKGRCAAEARLFFDIETSGLNWFQMLSREHVAKTLSCAFGFKEREAYGVILREKQRSFRNLILFQQILESPIPKTGHNGKFDNIFVRGDLGIHVQNYDFDTMLAAYQLDQNALVGLDKLIPVYRPDLGFYWEETESLLDEVYGYQNAPDDVLLLYNCKDVDATAALYNAFEPKLRAREMWPVFSQVTMPLAVALEDMEFYGVQIDVEATKALGRKKVREMAEAVKKFHQLTATQPEDLDEAGMAAWGVTADTYRPMNPGSTQQIAVLLYDVFGVKCTNFTEKGARQVNEEALASGRAKAPWVDTLLEWKGLKKELSTYIGWELREDGTEGILQKKKSGALLAVCDINGRVHTSYKVAGTSTGRLSSSPNLQNIPKTPEFRSLFIAAPGFNLIDADYAGLELRVFACISGDPEMLKIFKDGVDPHSATAAKMFGLTMDDFKGVLARGRVFASADEARAAMPDLKKEEITNQKDRKERKAAKVVNFGVLYGKGARSLAEELGVEKIEAQSYLNGWEKTYAVGTKWINSNIAEVRRTGEVRYSLGRSRPLPEIHSDDQALANGAERQATNTPIQGSGSDCMSIATVRVNIRLKAEYGLENVRAVMTIHDQLVVECREEITEGSARVVREEMERPAPVIPNLIPLEVDLHIKKTLGDSDK